MRDIPHEVMVMRESEPITKLPEGLYAQVFTGGLMSIHSDERWPWQVDLFESIDGTLQERGSGSSASSMLSDRPEIKKVFLIDLSEDRQARLHSELLESGMRLV